MKIGFDLDGVLCNIDVAVLRIIDNMPDTWGRASMEEWYYRERDPLLNPYDLLTEDDEFFIITSRRKHLHEITKRWVKKYFPNAKLFMLDLPEMLIGFTDVKAFFWEKVSEAKARMINKLHLDVYFDDSAINVQFLREMCPNTKIIQYGGRL